MLDKNCQRKLVNSDIALDEYVANVMAQVQN